MRAANRTCSRRAAGNAAPLCPPVRPPPQDVGVSTRRGRRGTQGVHARSPARPGSAAGGSTATGAGGRVSRRRVHPGFRACGRRRPVRCEARCKPGSRPWCTTRAQRVRGSAWAARRLPHMPPRLPWAPVGWPPGWPPRRPQLPLGVLGRPWPHVHRPEVDPAVCPSSIPLRTPAPPRQG